MKKVFLGRPGQPLPNYEAALAALGVEAARDAPERCDALLLPGGGDIHPRFYGQRVGGAKNVDEALDGRELALFRQFFEAGRPVLGVCRGMQVVNVALGGTLRQHVEGHSQTDGKDRLHAVCTDDAVLRSLYGKRFLVNSAHHQAVELPGKGLRVIARADDGVSEAIRHENGRVWGVQWHPERLGDAGLRLLRHFIEML